MYIYMYMYIIHVYDLGHKNQFELHMHAAIQQPNIYTHISYIYIEMYNI